MLANDTVSDSFVRQVCRSTPTVLLAREPIDGCDAVLVENLHAAQELTDHLLRHGRRRLVFVGDPAGSHDVTERYTGFRAALARSRTATEASLPLLVPLVEQSAQAVVDALLDMVEPADALVCANDELAVAVMSLLSGRGVGVRIEGRTHDVHPQVLPTRLVVRGSCGCPWSGPASTQGTP